MPVAPPKGIELAQSLWGLGAISLTFAFFCLLLILLSAKLGYEEGCDLFKVFFICFFMCGAGFGILGLNVYL